MKDIGIYLLVCVVGALVAVLSIEANDGKRQAERIHKLEADVRTYAGKYLDLQESLEDERESVRNAVEVAQYELAECRKGKR